MFDLTHVLLYCSLSCSTALVWVNWKSQKFNKEILKAYQDSVKSMIGMHQSYGDEYLRGYTEGCSVTSQLFMQNDARNQ